MYRNTALTSPVRDANSTMGTRFWRWRATVRVVADFTAFLAIILLFLFCYVVIKDLQPPRMGFYCEDTSIRYPYKHSTVPDWALVVGSFSIPIFTLIVGGFYEHFILKREQGPRINFGCCKFPEWPIRILQWLMVLVIALGLTEIVTAIGKQMGGQLRPHFLAVCQPDFSTFNCTDEQGFPRYVTDYECTGNPKDVLEARLSWPSGHASSAAVSLTFTAIYLLSLPIFYKRSILQLIVVVFSLFAAVICGATRVTDFHHHPFDVISGLIIGSTIAFAMGYYHLHHFGHTVTSETGYNLRRGSVMSHVLYRRTTLTGEEDSRDCEEVEETDKPTIVEEGVVGKNGTNQQAWQGVPEGVPV